jgi:predicted neuraminidase
MKLPVLLILLLAAAGAGCATARRAAAPSSPPAGAPAVVTAEFIYETAPFPSCHASTLAETKDGLLAAWFGGQDEGEPDVAIWTARRKDGRWSAPVLVADGVQPDGQRRYPCWNPVLYQPRRGPLLLFYKVGPSPAAWWGMLQTSTDQGRTWSTPRRLPEGQLGPVRNKPVSLRDGALLCGSSSEDQGWRVHLELTRDQGRTWERSGPLNEPSHFGAIQPTILCWPDRRIQLLNRSRQGWVTECWMGRDWQHWSPMQVTSLPNPNSGIDAVVLKDGRALLVYNHTHRGRSPLNVALSRDGREWKTALALETEPGEYSYPAVIQARDGQVHITYTWKRQRIKHVVLDPTQL